MKKYFVLVIVLLLFLIRAEKAAAENESNLAAEQLQQLDLSEMETFWEELQREAGEYMPELSLEKILQWFRGDDRGFSPGEVLSGLWRFLWQEIYLNLSLLGKLLLLAVVAAVLKNLEKAFANENIAAMTQSVVYLALIVIAMHSFSIAVELGRKTVGSMVDLILAALPLLLALLASLGSLASAAIFRPVIVFSVHFFASLTRGIIFPLIYLTTVLSIVNFFSPRITVSNMANLLKNLAVWGMGLSMTVFTGLLSVYGLASSVGDAVTIRTAKFTTNLLPVVGGVLSDAVETVAGATLILKNTVHIAGILILFFLVVFPLLKILVLVLIYKLAAALIQPLGETDLCDSLNIMGNCLSLVFAAVAVVGLVFYLAITIIAGAGNASFMLR
jgi:stage III sporulation protein AE